MTNFIERIIRVLSLDFQVYKEVEDDKAATIQAAIIVILSSMSGGFGYIYRFGTGGIFIGIMMTLVGWVVWIYLLYLIGTKILPESQTQANMAQLFRATGLASSPGLLRLLGMIPLLGNFVATVASLWILVTTILAAKQVFDYKSTTRAIVVCVIGWIGQWLVFLLFFIIFKGL